MLDDISLVAALLSLISMDAFRYNLTLFPACLTMHSERPVESNGNDRDSIIYGIASLSALTANLLTLFLGTFFGFMLSLVPKGSLKIFVHDMR